MASRESEFKTLTEVGTLGRGKSKHRPRNDPDLYGGEYPFVQTGDVKHAPFYLTKYTQTYNAKGLAQSKLWPPGTLCITIAANIADTAILAIPACFPDSILGFTPHPLKADVHYTKYCLDAFRGHMEQISKGTTQDNLSMDKLLKLRFWFPAHELQRKIAAVLTAYDDLIANNQLHIASLESMAEEIYREWFVRMRFPGADRRHASNGVPAGWEARSLRSLITHYIGGGWGEEQASTTCPDGAFVFRGTDLPAIQDGDWHEFVYRFHKTSALASRTLVAGDFVFEVSGGSTNQLLGRNLMVSAQLLEQLEAPAICASFCKLIRFDHAVIAPLWMKYFLKLYYDSGLVGLYQVQSTGISNYQFEAFITRQTVLVPDTRLQAEFCKLVEPLNEQRDSLARANLRLKKTRDALLPRLISGKLRVDALDIQFPPSMQQPPAEAAPREAIAR